MSELMAVGQALTMSSREIADLTGKRHDHVLRDVRSKVDASEMESASYLDSYGRTQAELVVKLDKAAALVSAYSFEAGIHLFGAAMENTQIARRVLDALREFDIPEELGEMFVYVAQNEATGNFKIGISKDPVARIKQLQVGNESPLSLVAVLNAPDRFQAERAIHKQCAAYHIRGEWFSAVPSVK